MTVTAADVKSLRDRTGAGMMECKRALEEAGGDAEKAVEILRVRGQAKAAKRGEREAANGVISSYVHANDQIGVIVPYGVTGANAQVAVQTVAATSSPFAVAVAAVAPGVFTADGSGRGQASVLHQDGTRNGVG